MDDSKFSRYEEDFFNSTRIVERGLRQLEKVGTKADTIIRIIVDIESELSETEGYIKAMEACCTGENNNSMNSNNFIIKQRGEKVKDYKEEYDDLLKSFNKTKLKAEKSVSPTLTSNNNTNKTNHFNTNNSSSTAISASKVRLVTNNQTLDESTQMLEESRNLLFQTEQIGNTVLSDLENQKESLLTSQNKVKETTKVTYDAKSILKRMSNRGIRLKICLYVIITILAAAIGLIIYYGIIVNVF